jgi:hypothetical protein
MKITQMKTNRDVQSWQAIHLPQVMANIQKQAVCEKAL